MGRLCIVGVDDNLILKDFVRAHVERLSANPVVVHLRNGEFSHDGRIIRQFYSSRPSLRRMAGMLPNAVHRRLFATEAARRAALADGFRRFLAQHDVDVILAEFGTTGALVTPFAKAAGIPLIVHFHGHDAHRASVVERMRPTYQEMFAYAHAVISVSRYMTEALVRLGARPEAIVENPYGPRDRFFSIRPTYEPVVLSLGRFTDIKANYLTLMAFRDVLTSHPQARLVMPGDGELLETCRTLAKVYGIAESVSFPAAVPHADVDRFFTAACCFAQHSVSPSYGDAEGTPVVALEASAAGLPVIATRHAGLREAVIDGETGFLVDELDVSAMSDRMSRCVGDAELCRRLGENARNHIREKFSLDRHIAVLQRTIDGARRA